MKAKKPPELPWLPPRTPNTWVCANGHVNPRNSISCGQCR